VRGLGRQLQAGQGTLHDMIEMDRPVVDDTVGGALVDADGQVLGMCLQGKFSALGYAVPIDLVRKVSDAVRKGGRVRWGRLGVEATDLNPGRAQALGIAGAAQLVSVQHHSPAAKAGLAPGDLVTQLGMNKIESVTDLVAALSEHHPGDALMIEFRRGGSSRSVLVTLATN
jgi:S1-C subfamily serine protease